MGLLMASLPVPSAPIVVWRALLIYTITRLLSLEGPGGGFDIPKEKCPPDIRSGGSLSEVTVRSAPPSILSSHATATTILNHYSSTSPKSPQFLSSGVSAQINRRSSPPSQSAGSTPLLSDPDSNSTLIHSSSNLPVDLGLIKQSQDIASPRPRQYQQKAQQAPFDLPLTPPNSTPGSSPERPDNRHNHQQHATQPMNILKTSKKVVNGFTISFKEPSNPLETPPATPQTNAAGAWVEQANPALAFLRKIFKPHGPREALSFATSVTINTQEGVTWEGIVLSLPGKSKTLYVDGKGAENVQLRESIVALLDLAGEHLDCEAFVIALERQTPALAGLIHSLLYVSGTVVTRPPFEVADNYVLVGIDM